MPAETAAFTAPFPILYVTDVKLRSRGATELAPPTDTPWGERVAYLADPDGLRIHLYGAVREVARAQT